MDKLDVYIRRTVLLTMGLVLMILGGLDLMFSVFGELGNTGEYYSSKAAMTYVLMTFPRHVYELLPMTSLLGALIGLGLLASSNELVVMQAAGIRVSRIVLAVMKPAALVMVLGLVLGEYVAPPLEVRAEVMKSLSRGADVIISQGGYWFKDQRKFMHVNAMESDGALLYGVTVYEFDEAQQPSQTLVAEQARYIVESAAQGSDSHHWRLEEVTRTRFSHGDSATQSEQSHLEETTLDFNMDPELLKVVMVEPDKMAISDLYQYAGYFRDQGQDASEYFLSFWKKLLQPLTTAALVLVATSFIFGPLRSATMGSRVFVAICFGLFFIIVQRMMNTVSLVYNFAPLIAVLIPIVVSALAGIYLLRRVA